MPLFRQHRGSLEESIATTEVIKSLEDLIYLIIKVNENTYGVSGFIEKIIIRPYPREGGNANFDERVGWYTHLVTAKFWYDKESFDKQLYPVGFLSESIEMSELIVEQEFYKKLYETI